MHLALVMGEPIASSPCLVRVHSECFTGDVLGSIRCDCGKQLKKAMEIISKEGTGVLLYLRQEGRARCRPPTASSGFRSGPAGTRGRPPV